MKILFFLCFFIALTWSSPLNTVCNKIPKCMYECDDPICEADYSIFCEPPKCEILFTNGTNLNRIKPKCRTTCIDQKKLNCTSFVENCPLCETHCDRPPCFPNCNIACERPSCGWHYSLPKNCRKPICQLVCEKGSCESNNVITTKTPKNTRTFRPKPTPIATAASSITTKQKKFQNNATSAIQKQDFYFITTCLLLSLFFSNF